MTKPRIIPDTEVGFSFEGKEFAPFDPERLVCEWYNWWSKSDYAPNKMPNSLHTRTAIFLATRNGPIDPPTPT